MKKRVCFVVDSIFTIGGVQRVTAVIAKELAKDYDVTIITFDREEEADRRLYGLEEADINFVFYSYPQLNRIKDVVNKAYSYLYKNHLPQNKITSDIYAYTSFPYEMRKSLTKVLRQGHYDTIVAVHAPLASRLATLRPSLPQTQLVGWIHNSFEALFGETSHYIGPNRKRHYVYQFRKLNHTVLLCKHDRKSYSQYDSALKPTVIYNPLTLKPGDESAGTSKRFLAVGRFAPKHKGFDLLIEAFHLFAQTNSDWHLDIVGEGTEQELYESLIKKYQLEDRITIHPFTSDIQSYYSQAHVYVLSSRWEGFGLVLVEAMSHGLPVVSSDLPTSQEIMGDFGLYFKTGDANSLAQQLEAATRIDWDRKSQEAMEIAKRFEVNHIVDQWKRLIEEQS